MKLHKKYCLIVNGCKYNIEKELYDKVKKKDLVEFRYSKYSGTLLGIRKIEN